MNATDECVRNDHLSDILSVAQTGGDVKGVGATDADTAIDAIENQSGVLPDLTEVKQGGEEYDRMYQMYRTKYSL